MQLFSQLAKSNFRKRLISYLAVTSSLLNTLSCQQDTPLIPRSTDQIARLEEWNLSGPVSNTTTINTGDTLTWIKIANSFYHISTATSSTYVYDSQKRLASQQTNGYRNDTGYGRSQSIQTYTYTYTPTQLIVLREGRRLSSWYAYDSLPARQYLPLNERGLVTSQPQFDGWYSVDDNGYNGISQLFGTSLMMREKDTLRRYNPEDYLIEATTVHSPVIPEPRRISYTIEAGNIVGSQQAEVAKPAPGQQAKLLTRLNQYDLSRPTIPNPHQFLGTSSRNLVAKAVDYQVNRPPLAQTYRYDYDTKGRVRYYYVSAGLASESNLYLIGRITYVD